MSIEALQINKSRTYINFSIANHLWSGIEHEDIRSWLRNFKDCKQDELFYVYKLLSQIIYYSEKDVIALLKEGIFSCVCKKRILQEQISNCFKLSQKALLNIFNEEIHNTAFIPLLVSNSPSESGNSITRYLVYEGIIPEDNVMYGADLPSFLDTNIVTRLVIVDDCVGSGDQLYEFWNKKLFVTGKKGFSICEYCDSKGIKIIYLSLFGYKKRVEELQKEFPSLQISCMRFLYDYNRVFFDGSCMWDSPDELHEAESFFQSVTESANIPMKGHGDLDFAFIMHRTIPDWSLPMFWKENSDWRLLIRRKNSNE